MICPGQVADLSEMAINLSTDLADNEMFLVFHGRLALHGLELPVEIGNVVESRFPTHLRDAHIIVLEKLTGISNAKVDEELGQCFPGELFKVPAEGGRGEVCDGGNFLQRQVPLEIL